MGGEKKEEEETMEKQKMEEGMNADVDISGVSMATCRLTALAGIKILLVRIGTSV